MIEGIKGGLAELESALGTEGESEMPADETTDMAGGISDATDAGAMPSENGEEDMPPMLKKFKRGY
jgi:hypothetical protein